MFYNFKGCGKDYYYTIKMCKRICISIHGRINWYLFLNANERYSAIERVCNSINNYSKN